jgi:hypothetical protein
MNPYMVEDNLGFMAVLPTDGDVYAFFDHLISPPESAGTEVQVDDVEDTLKKGSVYSARNAGSSRENRQLKFYATFNGLRVEVILHTWETYLNNLLHDKYGRKRFEIDRFINSGTADLLFPKKYYPTIIWKDEQTYVIEKIKSDKRSRNIK